MCIEKKLTFCCKYLFFWSLLFIFYPLLFVSLQSSCTRRQMENLCWVVLLWYHVHICILQFANVVPILLWKWDWAYSLIPSDSSFHLSRALNNRRFHGDVYLWEDTDLHFCSIQGQNCMLWWELREKIIHTSMWRKDVLSAPTAAFYKAIDCPEAASLVWALQQTSYLYLPQPFISLVFWFIALIKGHSPWLNIHW